MAANDFSVAFIIETTSQLDSTWNTGHRTGRTGGNNASLIHSRGGGGDCCPGLGNFVVPANLGRLGFEFGQNLVNLGRPCLCFGRIGGGIGVLERLEFRIQFSDAGGCGLNSGHGFFPSRETGISNPAKFPGHRYFTASAPTP
jgi:hypothetical protein